LLIYEINTQIYNKLTCLFINRN